LISDDDLNWTACGAPAVAGDRSVGFFDRSLFRAASQKLLTAYCFFANLEEGKYQK
jgi:hypothetical protein